jgi:hypothetical protein
MTEIVSIPTGVDFSAQINSSSPEDLPVIYTSKGNIPLDAMRYETEWVSETAYIMFSERWFLDDELVKSNSHCYGTNPLGEMTSSQQTF